MSLFRLAIAFLITLALSAPLIATPAFASTVHRRSTVSQAHHARHVAHRRHSRYRRRRPRGQQAIQPQRVTQIQQALIRAHYLSSPANGDWDQATVAAMQKYQADNGWQTKIMPDARALEKLGLGPDYSGALNAESASFDSPPPRPAIPPAEAAGFAAASGTVE